MYPPTHQSAISPWLACFRDLWHAIASIRNAQRFATVMLGIASLRDQSWMQASVSVRHFAEDTQVIKGELMILRQTHAKLPLNKRLSVIHVKPTNHKI